jgi:hypothetical protein
VENNEKFEITRVPLPTYFYAPLHIHDALRELMEETDEG